VMIGLHLAYVLNLPAFGVCQYGPRWLMTMVPFAMLGLPALLDLPGPAARVGRWTCLVAGLWSFAVSAAGALCGTMYCDTERFAFLDCIRELPGLSMQLYPLAPMCLGLMALAGAALAAAPLLSRAVARAPGRG